jgi:hypothetical protein
MRLFVNSLQTGFESDMSNFGGRVAAPHQIGYAPRSLD